MNIFESVENYIKSLTESTNNIFPNSKIRDDQGNLLVCYHATQNKFDEFDLSFFKQGKFGKGFYFTNSKKYVERHLNNKPGYIKECYLNMENPFNLSAEARKYGRQAFREHPELQKKLMEQVENAQANGYDGVIIESILGDPDSAEFVVYKPEQIYLIKETKIEEDNIKVNGLPFTKDNYISKLNEEWSDDVSIADRQHSRHLMHKSPNMRANTSGVLYGPKNNKDYTGYSQGPTSTKWAKDQIEELPRTPEEEQRLNKAKDLFKKDLSTIHNKKLDEIPEDKIISLLTNTAKFETQYPNEFKINQSLTNKNGVPLDFIEFAQSEDINTNYTKWWNFYKEKLNSFKSSI